MRKASGRAIHFVAKRVCEELKTRETHPLHGWSGTVIERNEAMGFDEPGGTRR